MAAPQENLFLDTEEDVPSDAVMRSLLSHLVLPLGGAAAMEQECIPEGNLQPPTGELKTEVFSPIPAKTTMNGGPEVLSSGSGPRGSTHLTASLDTKSPPSATLFSDQVEGKATLGGTGSSPILQHTRRGGPESPVYPLGSTLHPFGVSSGNRKSISSTFRETSHLSTMGSVGGTTVVKQLRHGSKSIASPPATSSRRVLPTAPFAGDNVALPMLNVLTLAMEKANAHAQEKKGAAERIRNRWEGSQERESSTRPAAVSSHSTANASFVQREMEHVQEARRSQREMTRFQEVLEVMESAARQRQRAQLATNHAKLEAPALSNTGAPAAAKASVNAILGESGFGEDKSGFVLSDSDEEEGESESRLIVGVSEEQERITSMRTSNRLVQRIEEKEQRRWLELQKKIIEMPEVLQTMQLRLKDSAERLKDARTARPLAPKAVLSGMLTLPALQPESALGTGCRATASKSLSGAPGDISWVSLPSSRATAGEGRAEPAAVLMSGEHSQSLSRPHRMPPSEEESRAGMLVLGSSRPGSTQLGESEMAMSPAIEYSSVPVPLPSERYLHRLLQRSNGRSVYGLKKRCVNQKERIQQQKLKNKRKNVGSPMVSPLSPVLRTVKEEDRKEAAEGEATERKRAVHFSNELRPSSSQQSVATPTSSEALTPEGTLQGARPTVDDVPEAREGTTTTAPASAAMNSHRIRFPVRRRRSPMPAVVGVGERGSAWLRHKTLSARRLGYIAQIKYGDDARRTCEGLDALHEMRMEMLNRDLFDAYNVSPPTTWEAKYRRASQGETARVKKKKSLLRSPATAFSGTLAVSKKEERELSPVPSGGKLAIRVEPSVTAAGSSITDLPATSFMDPRQMLERHRKRLFDVALELDEKERTEASLQYIDCLEALSKEKIMGASWIAAEATLARCRQLLARGPNYQRFSVFSALVHENFNPLQIVEWPVQEMLRALAAIFFVSPQHYRDWMAGIYQDMSYRHDYEGRFRAVDYTIPQKTIPKEAHVRITVHRARKLPRIDNVLFMAMPGGRGAGLTTTAKSTPSVLMDVTDTSPTKQSLTALLGDSADSIKKHEERDEITSPTLLETTENGKAELNTTAVSENPLLEEEAAGKAVTKPGEVGAPLEEGEREEGPEVIPPTPEFAVRLKVEDQVITSTAIPAGNSAPPVFNGDEIDFLFHDVPLEQSEGGDAQSKSGMQQHGDGEAQNTVTARQRIYFNDQAFKLHLYNIASVIEVDLVSNGLLVASGCLSMERYLYWKKRVIWLPLFGKYSERPTEVQLTIEVL